MRAGSGFGDRARGYGLVVACQAERGDDDVRNLVCLVEDLDGGREGLEVGDGGVGKQPAFTLETVRLSRFQGDALCLELIREYQIRLAQQALILWNFILGDIQLAVVAHDGIEHYASSALPL